MMVRRLIFPNGKEVVILAGRSRVVLQRWPGEAWEGIDPRILDSTVIPPGIRVETIRIKEAEIWRQR